MAHVMAITENTKSENVICATGGTQRTNVAKLPGRLRKTSFGRSRRTLSGSFGDNTQVVFSFNLCRLYGLLRRDTKNISRWRYLSRRGGFCPAAVDPPPTWRPYPARAATTAPAAATAAAKAAPEKEGSASAASAATDAGVSASTDAGVSAAHTGMSAAHAPTAATAGMHAATSATSAATAATSTTAATATGESYPLGRWRCSGIFLVEDIERRQANVGDFLLTKKDFVAS
jgi:hypothetical protein